VLRVNPHPFPSPCRLQFKLPEGPHQHSVSGSSLDSRGNREGSTQWVWQQQQQQQQQGSTLIPSTPELLAALAQQQRSAKEQQGRGFSSGDYTCMLEALLQAGDGLHKRADLDGLALAVRSSRSCSSSSSSKRNAEGEAAGQLLGIKRGSNTFGRSQATSPPRQQGQGAKQEQSSGAPSTPQLLQMLSRAVQEREAEQEWEARRTGSYSGRPFEMHEHDSAPATQQQRQQRQQQEWVLGQKKEDDLPGSCESNPKGSSISTSQLTASLNQAVMQQRGDAVQLESAVQGLNTSNTSHDVSCRGSHWHSQRPQRQQLPQELQQLFSHEDLPPQVLQSSQTLLEALSASVVAGSNRAAASGTEQGGAKHSKQQDEQHTPLYPSQAAEVQLQVITLV